MNWFIIALAVGIVIFSVTVFLLAKRAAHKEEPKTLLGVVHPKDDDTGA